MPVISLASGRVLEIHARLGDTVSKGQLLLKCRARTSRRRFPITGRPWPTKCWRARNWTAPSCCSTRAPSRRKIWKWPQDTEDKAKVTVETTPEHLACWAPTPTIRPRSSTIIAPVSGVITDQQVTQAAGTQGLASPNAFTISDLSHVWIVCDVYENNLSFVQTGRVRRYSAERLSEPGVPRADRATSDRSSIPIIRTAKVRLEVDNPGGLMRLGMFVTATFHGPQSRCTPPCRPRRFCICTTATGSIVPARRQNVPPRGSDRRHHAAGQHAGGASGIIPETQVVTDALVLENTAEQ